MNKVPGKVEFSLVCDENLAFKHAVMTFTYGFSDDPHAAGADRQVVQTDGGFKDGLSAFCRAAIDQMIKKHGTCSIEEMVKLNEEAAAEAAKLQPAAQE